MQAGLHDSDSGLCQRCIAFKWTTNVYCIHPSWMEHIFNKFEVKGIPFLLQGNISCGALPRNYPWSCISDDWFPSHWRILSQWLVFSRENKQPHSQYYSLLHWTLIILAQCACAYRVICAWAGWVCMCMHFLQWEFSNKCVYFSGCVSHCCVPVCVYHTKRGGRRKPCSNSPVKPSTPISSHGQSLTQYTHLHRSWWDPPWALPCDWGSSSTVCASPLYFYSNTIVTEGKRGGSMDDLHTVIIHG